MKQPPFPILPIPFGPALQASCLRQCSSARLITLAVACSANCSPVALVNPPLRGVGAGGMGGKHGALVLCAFSWVLLPAHPPCIAPCYSLSSSSPVPLAPTGPHTLLLCHCSCSFCCSSLLHCLSFLLFAFGLCVFGSRPSCARGDDAHHPHSRL